MTEPEVWEALEEHYRHQNWNGVAVLADWFEEQEQAPLANTLRWLSRKESENKPVLFQSRGEHWHENRVAYLDVNVRSWWTFADALFAVHRDRTKVLENLL